MMLFLRDFFYKCITQFSKELVVGKCCSDGVGLGLGERQQRSPARSPVEPEPVHAGLHTYTLLLYIFQGGYEKKRFFFSEIQ